MTVQPGAGRVRGPTTTVWAKFAFALCLPFISNGMALAQSEASSAATTDWATEFADAFKNGEFDLGFRYRYEYVDSGIFDRNANASTLRTRLVYKSGEFRNVFLTLNVDDVRPIVANNFNDTRNGKTQYPIVADPKGTDLNLASLTWNGLENGSLVLGRQRIIRANHRFVANVVWRQNEQTYDALSFSYKVSEKFDFFVSYVDRVKRIFGPNEGVPTSSFRSNSFLFDAGYEFSPLFKLFGYMYLLEFDNSAVFSSQTVGLRGTGAYEFGNGPTLDYQVEFAGQSDYKNNPDSYDANYYLLDAALKWERFGFRLGYEVLEGDGSNGSFQTPLATLHKFNGWADRFLVTPVDGLEDLYIEGNAQFLKGKWALVYHWFSANNGGGDWGDELDFVASWKFKKHYSVLIKAALYKADQWAWDTDKFWVMLNADF